MIAPHSPLRVLCLGCGLAARIHSRVLRHMPDVELAYASRTPERAAEFRLKYGGVRSWGSYEQGLADPDVHVVLVATPTATHADLTLRSLRAGKHVIVEKPAFLRATDADVVRDAAAAVGRQVFVAENYVYKPMARELRVLIESGALGEVRFVSLNATRWQPAQGWRAEPAMSGGGALFEAGVHWISFAARLGLGLKDVQGFRAGGTTGPDQSSLTVFQYTNGAIGTLAHSWELRAPLGGARSSRVQGTDGSVTFESHGFASYTTGVRRRLRLHLRDTFGYRAMHADFLGAIRSDGAPYYTLDMAQRDLEWLERAQADVK